MAGVGAGLEKAGADMEDGDGCKQQRKTEVEAASTEVWLSIVVLVTDVVGNHIYGFRLIFTVLLPQSRRATERNGKCTLDFLRSSSSFKIVMDCVDPSLFLVF